LEGLAVELAVLTELEVELEDADEEEGVDEVSGPDLRCLEGGGWRMLKLEHEEKVEL